MIGTFFDRDGRAELRRLSRFTTPIQMPQVLHALHSCPSVVQSRWPKVSPESVDGTHSDRRHFLMALASSSLLTVTGAEPLNSPSSFP